MSAGRSGPTPFQGVLLLIAGSFIISFSAVFVRLADVGPTQSGMYRTLLGAVALLVYVAARRDSLWRGWTALGYAVVAGLFFAFDLFCWHRSIIYIGPGLATIMGNFQVFFLAVIGIAIFKEAVTWRFVVAIPLALLGLTLLVGVDWSALPSSYGKGILFGVLTAVAYASFLLTVRRAQMGPVRLSPAGNLVIISLVTAGILALTVKAEGGSFKVPDRQTLLILVAYGVVCQALGWIVISSALRVVAASKAGLLLLLQPTLTFIWDILFFKRPTSSLEAFGAVLAVSAIYLGNSRRARRSNDGS